MAALPATIDSAAKPKAKFNPNTILGHSGSYVPGQPSRDGAEVVRRCLGRGCVYPNGCAAVCRLMAE